MKEKIASPKKTREIINQYNFVLQKKYGQNFLIDEYVLNKIIEAANITKEDMVIEIGPGIGSLTQYLAENAREVVAVEIDKQLIPILNDTLKEYDNIEIINEDILKLDLNPLIKEKNNNKPVKIVANLPYYITTPIIMGLFEDEVPIDSITVMIQKEVAQRMQAEPGTKDYGALSLAVKYYSKPYIVANVPQNCFIPRPNVDSAVIQLKKYEKPIIEVQDKKLMFQIIRASFNQRRKTMLNSVSNQLDIDKEKVKLTLEKMDKPTNIRGEALTLEEFALFTEILTHLNGDHS
ncbi:dimethyladenosine transferase [Natranaerovirga hydrolytica]|uniref:Ribosomal RNA small subunit methyltransferase A n=1 Tax=Natranaerovirga hydrolytica TaxID=680378 RepID=A0A4R1N3H8_9FIRM|nr:16S rRNA (adenine(1518)-N(6)/adenine(1519)-N(6))-dimethyltransferase RsmA [Natranaerovirga hydrolytica]TCL00052.1 dimethyladenosine transferase [Natranaerovirga hydrolytica]